MGVLQIQKRSDLPRTDCGFCPAYSRLHFVDYPNGQNRLTIGNGASMPVIVTDNLYALNADDNLITLCNRKPSLSCDFDRLNN